MARPAFQRFQNLRTRCRAQHHRPLFRRPIQFLHLPVPKGRTDDAYFAPLEKLKLRPETELYLGLIHHNDAAGDAARLAAARRHVRVDGIATECGMARGDPTRLAALLAAHVRAVTL